MKGIMSLLVRKRYERLPFEVKATIGVSILSVGAVLVGLGVVIVLKGTGLNPYLATFFAFVSFIAILNEIWVRAENTFAKEL